jgi:arylsulfatase A-like enzyme
VPGKDYQCCTRLLQAVNEGEVQFSAADLEYINGLYAAGLAQFDRDLSLLFAELRRRGFLDGALVVITSDHGEEFWEHQKLMHGGFHEEVVRVPLIVVPPLGTSLGTRTISALTRSIDIAPTIADFVGAAALGAGRSLRTAMRSGGAQADGDVLILESLLRASDALGPYLYAHDERTPRFWDLRADPTEQRELLQNNPDESTRARAQAAAEKYLGLQRTAREFDRKVRAGSQAQAPELSPEEDAKLRSLGYGGR